MMEIERIFVRVFFSYIFLLVLLRLTAKRTIAQSTSFDFVLAIIIGELFDGFCWAEVPASQFITAVGTIFLLDVIIRHGAYINQRFERIVDFPPEIILRDGKPVREALRAEQLNENDLEMMVKQVAGLERDQWVEVATARLESNGKPSVIKHEWANEAQQSDAARLPTHPSTNPE